MTTETSDDHDRDEEEQRQPTISRRSIVGGVLAAAAGVAGAGASGALARSSAAPSGTFPSSTDDPLLKIRADRVRLVGRTSDPSSPADGTLWYRSDL